MRAFLRWLRFGWLFDALSRLNEMFGNDDDQRPGTGARRAQGARRAGRRRK